MKFDSNGKSVLLHNLGLSPLELVLASVLRVKAYVYGCFERYLYRCAISNERKVLANLTDKELKDIGIDRVQAIHESQRQFSDVPINRGD